MKKGSLQLLTILCFVLSFFLLDRIGVSYVLKNLPLETAWGENPVSTFFWRLAHIPKKELREYRVVIAGSSIAGYGILPEKLESLLNTEMSASGETVRVFTFSHQGMNPMHLLVQKESLLALKPDLVILPVNMVDFRLERPLVLGLMEKLSLPGNSNGKREALNSLYRDLILLDDYFPHTPFAFLETFPEYLTTPEKARLLLLGSVQTYGKRSLIRSTIEALYSAHFTAGRSYHHYMGIDVGSGGVNFRGWTGRTFSLMSNPILRKDGVLLQAPRELFTENENPLLRMEPGECTKEALVPAASIVRLSPGWQRIPPEALPESPQICFRIDRDFYSDEFGYRIALRLSHLLGRERAAGVGLTRPLRMEDSLYPAMSDADYRDSFEKRLWQFDRPGTEYLEMLLQAKKTWASREFAPDLPGPDLLRKFVYHLDEAKIPLLLYNAPENPITLDLYKDSRWYQGYLDFLENTALSSNRNRYMDLSEPLPSQEFYDYHHLTYGGASRMTELLSREILRNRKNGSYGN